MVNILNYILDFFRGHRDAPVMLNGLKIGEECSRCGRRRKTEAVFL